LLQGVDRVSIGEIRKYENACHLRGRKAISELDTEDYVEQKMCDFGVTGDRALNGDNKQNTEKS
jgi:hypothetical protein